MTLSSRPLKDTIYDQLARIGKALSSGPRLELLDLLRQGPRTVEALAKQVGQPVANTSHHLQVLRRVHLVDAQKAGVHVTYRIADEAVDGFFRSFQSLAESRLLELEQATQTLQRSRGSLEPMDGEALLARVSSGAAIVLDVRPEEEYRAGHLPGAVSIPLADLERHLAELPRNREIVVYCRGPYCVMALDAVVLLRNRGFRAVWLAEGVPDWRARDLPIEVIAAKEAN